MRLFPHFVWPMVLTGTGVLAALLAAHLFSLGGSFPARAAQAATLLARSLDRTAASVDSQTAQAILSAQFDYDQQIHSIHLLSPEGVAVVALVRDESAALPAWSRGFGARTYVASAPVGQGRMLAASWTPAPLLREAGRTLWYYAIAWATLVLLTMIVMARRTRPLRETLLGVGHLAAAAQDGDYAMRVADDKGPAEGRLAAAGGNELVAMLAAEANATKRHRAVFEQVFAKLPVAAAIKDTQRRYRHVNPAWELLWGARAPKVLGHKDSELRSTLGHHSLHDKTDQAILNDRDALAYTVEQTLGEGRGHSSLRVHKARLVDGHGEPESILSVFQDVSAQAQSERLVRETLTHQQDLEAREREHSQTIASASHELRAPLNSILGASNLLRRHIVEPEARQHLATIYASSTHMLELANNLISAAALGDGSEAGRRAEFYLADVLDGTIAILRPLAVAKRLELQQQLSAPEHLSLIGDAVRIKQVLMNLVSNAIKFTPAGRVALAVTANAQGDEYSLCFSVTDTGAGLPPERLDALRRRALASHAGAGQGLGLSIAARLVEAMGGELDGESGVGQGTRLAFTLRLPGRVAAPSVDPEHARRALEVPRLLIIDDDEANQYILRKILLEQHYSVSQFGRAEEALTALESESFDLILMDHQLPGMTGLEASERILACTAVPPPIVVMSAGIDAAAHQRYSALGIDVYIRPIEIDEFLKTIRRALSAREAHSLADAKPLVDWVYIEQVRRQAVDSEFIRKLEAVFTVSTEKRLNHLAEALNVGDLEKVRSLLHAMRASAGSLGARRLAEVLREAMSIPGAALLQRSDVLLGSIRRVLRDTQRALGQRDGDTPSTTAE